MLFCSHLFLILEKDGTEVTIKGCTVCEVNGVDLCKEECHSEKISGIAGTGCICKTDLCNGSPTLLINFYVFGFLVLYYFMKWITKCLNIG